MSSSSTRAPALRRARALAGVAQLFLLACSGPRSSGPSTAAPPAPAEARRVDGRVAMGTVLEIELRGLDGAPAESLLADLFAEVEEEEKLFSRFDPTAALVAVNARAGQGWTPVDPRLADLLAQSQALGARTHGTFDVTVGPLVELWTSAGKSGELPSPAALAQARARVGVDRIRVEQAPPRVELPRGTSLDLGGVAKGFALDQLAPRITRAGARAALLTFGQSSLQALGAPAGESGWRILLPDAQEGFAGVITLRDRALSVSGSLGQSTEIAGRRYGHILDPRSGQPLASDRFAAVVAPTGTIAEALSKALLLLEPAEAQALFDAFPDSEGMRIEDDGSRWYSSGWWEVTRFAPWDSTR